MLFGTNKKKSEGQGSFLQVDNIYQQGVATVKDLIAPSAVKIAPNNIQIGETFARTLFVLTYPRYLHTNWFSPIINLDFPMNISMFIHPVDTTEILKSLRKTTTQVQSQISIEEREGLVRNPILETALEDIESLRDNLQQGTEKFFRFGLYITIFSDTLESLNKMARELEAILEAQLVYVKPSVLKVEQGFASTMPLGNDELSIGNNLNTAPLSTTFPFVSADLSSNEGILYGINRHNNGLILFDRYKMENANMVVFAKSGGGKSYTVKLEIFRSMMNGTNVMVIDPENEYKYLCDTVGGTYIKMSLDSDFHINPFDLPKVGSDEDPEDILRGSIASIIGLLHIMLGDVTPEEDSILDIAIKETYAIRDITPQTNFQTLNANSYPTMSDLYEVLRNSEGGESLATRLYKYTEGIFAGIMNQPTNVKIDNQLVVFNIRDLEEQLRPIAMFMVLHYVWNEMRSEIKKRMIVVDEAWVMMQNDDAAQFLFGIAKRCRKYYTGLTTITQDIADFLASRYGKPIVTNSSLQLLLRQSPAAIDAIKETFYLTDQEKFLLLESNVGEGILFAGSRHVAIKVIASYSEDQIITSDPKQLMEIEQAKRDFEDEGL